MEILLTGLGLSPLFAARPLLSLMTGGLTLLAIRYVEREGRMPPSLAIVAALIILGLAATVESVAKALRQFVEDLADHDHVQKALSIVGRLVPTALGVLFAYVMLASEQPGGVLITASGVARGAAQPPVLDSWTDGLLLGAVGLSVWGFGTFRERLAAALAVFPWSVEPTVRRLYGLVEVNVCWVGAAAAALWPSFAGVLFAVCAVTSATVLSRLRGFEERQRTACAACGARVHRCAPACPSCAAERVPARLGMFGRALEKTAEELATHRLHLLGALRCGRCAEPLLQGASGACRCCGTPAFPDTASLERFVAYADKRWWVLVPVLAMLGTVPLLGPIIGLWLYRLSPAGALGAFARWRSRVSAKLLVGLALQALAVFQPLPLVGAVTLPVLVGLLHAQSRRAVLARSEDLPAAVSEGSAPALT